MTQTSPSLFRTPEEWARYQIERAESGEGIEPGLYDEPNWYRRPLGEERGPEVERVRILEEIAQRIRDFQEATRYSEQKVKEAAEARGVAEAMENQLREFIVEAYQADEGVRIFVQTSTVALKIAMES